MVVFDASVLIKLFRQKTSGEEKKKLDHLIQTLTESRVQVLIPTPALTEYLARAGKAASEVLEEIRKQPVFRIAPFDQRSAVECAVAIDRDLTAGDKRGGSGATWAKVKFDRQIVAIAKANSVQQIYSEDGDIKKLAKREGIQVLSVADLELPPADNQPSLDFEEPKQ